MNNLIFAMKIAEFILFIEITRIKMKKLYM